MKSQFTSVLVKYEGTVVLECKCLSWNLKDIPPLIPGRNLSP